MTDPIPRKTCVCGWERPLFGVTRTDGLLPSEALCVAYDCPRCGRAYVAGEVTREAQSSQRARAIAEAAIGIRSRKLS